MIKYVFLLAVALFGAQALATEVDVSKEPDQVLSGEKVKETLSGKEFTANTYDGNVTKVTFHADGKLHGSVQGRSSIDIGSWQIEGNTICMNWRRWPSSCREVAVKDGALILGAGTQQPLRQKKS